MARLPIPGSDNNTWGSILNSFLQVSHNPDGTLLSSAIVASGAVTQINGKSPTSGSVALTASDVGALSTGATAGGDLSGTYPNPSVAKLNGVSISGVPSAGAFLTATSTTAAAWQPAANGSGTILARTFYNPSTNVSYGGSGFTATLIDSTNCVVTFTAPASGKVKVRLGVTLAANSQVNLGITASTSSPSSYVSSSSGTCAGGAYAQASGSGLMSTVPEWDVSGLTPGAAYTWYGVFGPNSNPAITAGSGPNGGPMFLEVVQL